MPFAAWWEANCNFCGSQITLNFGNTGGFWFVFSIDSPCQIHLISLWTLDVFKKIMKYRKDFNKRGNMFSTLKLESNLQHREYKMCFTCQCFASFCLCMISLKYDLTEGAKDLIEWYSFFLVLSFKTKPAFLLTLAEICMSYSIALNPLNVISKLISKVNLSFPN